MRNVLIVSGGFARPWAAMAAARTRDELGLSDSALRIELVGRDMERRERSQPGYATCLDLGRWGAPTAHDGACKQSPPLATAPSHRYNEETITRHVDSARLCW